MVCTAGLGVLMIPLNALLEAAVSRLPWVVEQAVTGGVLGGVYFGVHYGCRCVCAQHGCLQYVVCVCVCVCVWITYRGVLGGVYLRVRYGW